MTRLNVRLPHCLRPGFLSIDLPKEVICLSHSTILLKPISHPLRNIHRRPSSRYDEVLKCKRFFSFSFLDWACITLSIFCKGIIKFLSLLSHIVWGEEDTKPTWTRMHISSLVYPFSIIKSFIDQCLDIKWINIIQKKTQ